jgi:stage III sporulation protein AF
VLDILGGLVRQVVLIVLLAVFVEMLLPAGDLSRFVRLTMGLFVVAAILTSFAQLLPRIAPAMAGFRAVGTAVEMAEIRRQAQALQQYQQDLALEHYRQQLAGQVAALLRSTEGLEVRQVQVFLEEDKEPGASGAIRQLQIEARPRPRGTVAPVTGGVGGENAPEGPAAAVAGAREKLAFFYGLSPEQVVIRLVE